LSAIEEQWANPKSFSLNLIVKYTAALLVSDCVWRDVGMFALTDKPGSVAAAKPKNKQWNHHPELPIGVSPLFTRLWCVARFFSSTGLHLYFYVSGHQRDERRYGPIVCTN